MIMSFFFTFCTHCVTQELQTYSLFTSCVKNFSESLYTVFKVVITLTILQDIEMSISLMTSSDQFDNACFTAH